MNGTIQGVVHGRTIELTSDPGLDDGAVVEVVVRLVEPRTAWGDGIRRSAGALSDHWTEADDRILEGIQQDRARDDRPELLSSASCWIQTPDRRISSGHQV